MTALTIPSIADACIVSDTIFLPPGNTIGFSTDGRACAKSLASDAIYFHKYYRTMTPILRSATIPATLDLNQ
jgi:hypothetical protein